MKAITLHGPGDVRVESVPDPRIVDPTDAVLRITTSAVFDRKEDRAIKVMLKP